MFCRCTTFTFAENKQSCFSKQTTNQYQEDQHPKGQPVVGAAADNYNLNSTLPKKRMQSP